MKIDKQMANLEIADLLNAVATAYQIKNKEKNKFKIIAYQRAADAVEHLSSEAKDLWDDGKLTDVAGIGKSIAEHLGEIFDHGKSTHFKKVMTSIPPATFELIKISGIGPKTAYKLCQKLKISERNPIDFLERMAKKKKIRSIEGFGEDSEESILAGIEELRGRTIRLLLPYAEKIADEVIDWLKKDNYAKKIDVLGSLRRKASTIGDVDIAVATNNPRKVIDHFCKFPKAKRVLERGKSSASIIIPGDRQVDLKVQEPKSYGSLLQHFTGSKHHNIALREFALKRGFSLNEYGVKKRNTKQPPASRQGGTRITKFRTEKQFYNFLGMKWIAPELRENMGEIEVALQDKLPKLIKTSDIKADLQIHSDFDIETSHDLGESSMEDIVKKADELGYEYLAMTEHNPSQGKHNDRQIVDLLKRKKEVVDGVNDSLGILSHPDPARRGKDPDEIFHCAQDDSGCANTRILKRVFNSLEIDILPSGKLPLSEKALEILDFALVSIHSSFKQNRDKMTKRVLDGLSHPKVKIFAHPTGRKLNKREGVELNWPKVFDFCKANNKWIEINADPMRLDLPDILVKDAIENGVLLTLGTDAHHISMMDNMRYGVYVARRGWAEKVNIVNTRSLKQFEKMLE